MQKKLFVGNLSWDVKDEDLNKTFAEAGNIVSASVISDRMSGRSKGFGFVEMSTEEEAAKAIEMFNGKDLMGRPMTVNEARPMTERKDSDNNHNA